MDFIDATTTPAWARLTDLAQHFVPDLPGWFATEPDRAARWTCQAGGLRADLSKNLVTEPVAQALLDLADQVGLAARRDAMFAGQRINLTENRSVLHTALRRPASDQLVVDGVDVVAEVHQVLAQMYALADRIRGGDWLGVTGRPITTVVNIGIGGSDLGPVMAYEALKPYVQPGLTCRFVSNIDPTDVYEKTKDLDPATTLFIVVSKTFSTLETLTNARLARAWLWDRLAVAGAIGDSPADRSAAVAHHFVACSTALDKVAAFGIDPANALGFWDWVGGRYSVDSAVGLALAIAIGPAGFADFLDGFHLIDQHFCTADLAHNLPVLMGLLNVWYRNFLGASSHAILPYSQYLHRFPAYLQQLTMESNGKSVRLDGSPVSSDTGEVFWGEPGTNGQHAFYQLIHQGTSLIPADFIALANPAQPLRDGDADVHELFLGNFFAQTKALAFGKTAAEVRAEGTPTQVESPDSSLAVPRPRMVLTSEARSTPEAIVSARVFPGNRPTTSIMAEALTPSVLGQLIALYEHITFVQGVVWGIDSFDQWGVELGKQLAIELAPAIAGDAAALAAQDSSTRGLIDYYRTVRK